ncbi:lipopolysaccharide biosynthesis protein [Arthrobacter sp. VKM Ac-2550]|uniref:lipopolysaccharide biosynthesis protein n=1 Tax=Crystallibacter permensis TaxID=1938888 RepID=UPI0022276FEB|nr:lipopolysaccharide biosynthesis protein [Arthrobacter sp. VKM Ac-2550]
MWQGLAQGVAKAIVLATTIVLARLLSPEEYGLVALALVLIAYAETLADAGVAQALVYLPRTKEAARAALFISVVVGGLLSGIAFASAPAIAGYFKSPEVGPLVQVLAVSLLATSLSAVPDALLRRELDFQRITVATVIRATGTGAVTVGFAFAGYGAWSLAIGTVAGSLLYAIACWILLPDRVPMQIWRVRRQDLKANLHFGIPAAGSTLLAKLIFDIDYLIIGGMLGAQALGYYTLAFRLPEFVILNVFFVLSTVTFPLYSRARNDPDRLRSGYLKSVQIQAVFGVSAGVGLAVVAPVLVPVLFGGRWMDAVLPLVFLALYAAARSLGVGANDVYKALGRPGISIKISLIRLLILVPVLLYATQWGIVGVACAQFCVALVFALGMQIVAAKVLDLRPSQLLRAVVPGLSCGVVVAVVGLAGLVPIESELAALTALITAGVAGVYLLIRFAFRPLHDEVLQLFLRR